MPESNAEAIRQRAISEFLESSQTGPSGIRPGRLFSFAGGSAPGADTDYIFPSGVATDQWVTIASTEGSTGSFAALSRLPIGALVSHPAAAGFPSVNALTQGYMRSPTVMTGLMVGVLPAFPAVFGLSSATADWLEPVRARIDELNSAIDVKQWAKQIIEVCANFSISEPAIDLSEEGTIDLYFKEGEYGLLLVVNNDGLLQIFGDLPNDQWRSRYNMSGNIWVRHLHQIMVDFAVA